MIAGKLRDNIILSLLRQEPDEFCSGVPPGSHKDGRNTDDPNTQEGKNQFEGNGTHEHYSLLNR
jgi:hypothetical protein